MLKAIGAALTSLGTSSAVCLAALACSSAAPVKSPRAAPLMAPATPSGLADTTRVEAVGTAFDVEQASAPPALPETSDALVPLFGKNVPTAFVAAAPAGHWAVVCEASVEGSGDGKLKVRLTQRGEFEGDPLRHTLYINGTRIGIDEFAGSDPTGRYVAFVTAGELQLLDTRSARAISLPGVDTRATQASFQSLRSVAFSDDGRYLAYVRGKTTSILVIRDLARQTEQTTALAGSPVYRIQFTSGSRFVQLETPARDTNKNGRLDWSSPERKGPPPCPSPIPTYNVWQFPGDESDVSLFDVETGRLSIPEGYALAVGNFVVRRTEDLRLLVDQPGQASMPVSSPECNGRVLHVDGASGSVLVGCSSAWGQRRQMFLRTRDLRLELGFDLAAYELDTALPTKEPIIPLYPGNLSLLLNVRTRERWPLVDGTQVVAVYGTTALLERELQLTLVSLNPDASTTPLSGPVKRTPFSGVVLQGTMVSVGPHVFDLGKRAYLGRYDVEGTPLALSREGDGLFPVKAATPTALGFGPLLWHSPAKAP